jgi:murein L,D-transpeptidase YcbB/YkuD
MTRIFRSLAAAALAAVVIALFAPVRAAESTDALLAGWIDRLEAEAEALAEQMRHPATAVAGGYALREGSAGPRVGQLTARLGELGYLPEAERGSVFTPAVEAAVRTFQDDRGLFVDGIVGPQTIGEMNRTPEDSLRALHWTIEQMREARIDLPDRLLVINVAGTDAMLIEDGEIVMEMRAAVGRPTRRTPLMRDEIVNVTVNPSWSVPPTIMREDVMPRLRGEGGTGISYASVWLDGERVNPADVDWSEVSPGQVWIRQSPGRHNALGRFVFWLTNDQNIFVHDTNAPYVFDRAYRAVSSGCIRVADARRLADYLLERNGHDTSAVDGMLQTTRTRVLELDEPLPVYVTYWTASVRPADEAVVYHRDVYNLMRGYEPGDRLASTGVEAPAEAAGSDS